MNGEVKLFGMLSELGVEAHHIKAILDTLRKRRVVLAAEHIVAAEVVVHPDGHVSAYIYLTGGWEVMVYPDQNKVKVDHASW